VKAKIAMFCTFAVLMTTPAWGIYNANLTGTVSMVLTYDGVSPILVRLNNQPSSHPTCDPSFFAIAADNDTKSTDRMYARLLVALATAQPTNLGYDNLGNCANGYIRIHRVG
jgi:hypothetical protein